MKVIAVLAAVALMVVIGLFAGLNRRVLRGLALAIPLPMMQWPSLAVMLFSAELYRGTSRGMEISLTYLLSFAMMIALSFRRVKGKFLPDLGAVFFFLYWLLSIPSLMNCHPDIDPGLTQTGYMYAWYEIWKMPMMFMVYKAVRGYCKLTDDVDAPLIGLSVVAVVNFLEVARQHVIVHLAQARGVFAHQNSMAMWALMVGALFFAAYLNKPKSRLWRLYSFVFIAGAAACFRTYSRGAIACLPIACFVVICASFVRNFTFRMPSRLIPLVLVGIVGLTLALPKFIERFEGAAESSANKRVGLALSARNMIADHPWAGVGLNNWGIKINPPYDYAVHRKEFGFGDDFKEGIVETIYLLVWAECGTPCFIALLGLFFWHWWKAFKLTGRLRGQPNFWIAAGALGGLTGLYLQSMLEWVLKQSISFTELMIVFALISYLNEKADSDDRAKHLAKLAAKKTVKTVDEALETGKETQYA